MLSHKRSNLEDADDVNENTVRVDDQATCSISVEWHSYNKEKIIEFT